MMRKRKKIQLLKRLHQKPLKETKQNPKRKKIHYLKKVHNKPLRKTKGDWKNLIRSQEMSNSKSKAKREAMKKTNLTILRKTFQFREEQKYQKREALQNTLRERESMVMNKITNDEVNYLSFILNLTFTELRFFFIIYRV